MHSDPKTHLRDEAVELISTAKQHSPVVVVDVVVVGRKELLQRPTT